MFADGFDIVVNDWWVDQVLKKQKLIVFQFSYAHNGATKRIQLIDEFGCPVDDKLISRFRGSWSDSGIFETQVYAYMKTFRFTGSPALYIECDVRMCHGRCPVSTPDLNTHKDERLMLLNFRANHVTGGTWRALLREKFLRSQQTRLCPTTSVCSNRFEFCKMKMSQGLEEDQIHVRNHVFRYHSIDEWNYFSQLKIRLKPASGRQFYRLLRLFVRCCSAFSLAHFS